MSKAIIVVKEQNGMKYGRMQKVFDAVPEDRTSEMPMCFDCLEDVEVLTAANQARARRKAAHREAALRQERRRVEAERKAAKWRLGMKLASAVVCLICVLTGLGIVAQGGSLWMGCLSWASGALAMVIGGW